MSQRIKAQDSPRWCENHQKWGDHHTDRCPQDNFKPYDSDHTALVHALWAAEHKGLTLNSFDELASHIMRSKWFQAVKAHTQAEREAEARQLLANVFRDWIHGTTLSQCSMGADTCPDWPLANHLADLACDALERRFGGGER